MTFYLNLTKTKKTGLKKRSHDYYIQVQCAMYCTKRRWCDLVTLTKTIHIGKIPMDLRFSTNILPKLKHFYFTAVLPEMATLQAKIREPEE